MSSTKVISVSLPPQQVDLIQAAVDAGEFTTRSGVVSAALRLWRDVQSGAKTIENVSKPAAPAAPAAPSKDGVSES